MNKEAASFFSRDRRLYKAAVELAKSDVLYLGDISRLSAREFLHKLGKREDCAQEIIKELAQVGISLNARSPWWKRPRNRL